MHYETFELRIQPGLHDAYEAVVTRSLAGDARVGFTLPFSQAELDARLGQTLGASRHLGAAGEEATGPGDPRDLGTQLYQAAFGGEVSRCLVRSLDEAKRGGAGLRIRLRIDDRLPALADLPWEYLYAPELGRFLALSADTPLLRYLEVPHAAVMRPASPPLLVLVVLSNPAGVTPLAVEEEWARVQTAVAGLGANQVRLERVAATWPALQARLRQGRAHVLHFIGHGYFDEEAQGGQGEGGLLFEDDAGRPVRMPASRFKVLVQDTESLRLIFLNACEGARGGRSDSFAGVAQQLVQQALPAVLAMQFPVSDRAAIALSQEFYRALAGGYPLEAAVSEARKAIFGPEGSPEWGTPVLFSRADDNRLIELPEDELPSHVTVAVPPESHPPPDVKEWFIGRAQEMSAFSASLAADRVAVIAGMTGIGKTALAARLAYQVAASPDRIFWHQFHEGEGIDTIIWRLAGMLWRHGRRALWELLEGARQSGGQPPPAEVLLDYLVQLMRGQHYVLCLDDFHHAEEDPLVEKAVDRLHILLAAGEIKLIVTSRHMPTAFRTLSFVPLGGLSRADATDFLATRKVTLVPDLLAELHQRTDGNAELLSLAAHALQRSRQPAQVVKRLADEEDIETFLLREVDKGLTADAKQVMSGVAALLGYPGTRDAIEATLASGGLKRTLRYLVNRFLLREQEGRLDHEYLAHAIVQAFYYELLSRKERQELHRRAGEYYEREEPDRVRAAMHYQRAGDSVRAVELATADVWVAINQGQARLLRSLLGQLSQARLDAQSSARAQLALGEVLAFLGESQLARAAYEMALANIEAESSAVAVDLEAHACLGMGTWLANQDSEEALSWIERGLSLASTAHPEQLAALHNRHGALLVGQAKYDEAIAALDRALALLPVTASQLRANVLTNLGAAHSWAGNMAWGSEYTRQALALNRQLHDLYGLLGILSNIGIEKEIAGDWSGAAADYGEALRLAEQLGSLAEQARIHNLLGTLRLHQGEDVAAEDHLQRAIALFRQIDNLEYLAATLPVLAQLRLGQQDRNAARTALAEAEALAGEGRWDYILPETFTTQAYLALAENDLTQAQDRADRAIALAAALGQPVEEGKAWRAKGQVLVVAGQEIETQAAFERSLALLTDHDPYETARTQAQWGLALVANSDPTRSAALLREARATFEHLGARRDVAEVGQPFGPGF